MLGAVALVRHHRAHRGGGGGARARRGAFMTRSSARAVGAAPSSCASSSASSARSMTPLPSRSAPQTTTPPIAASPRPPPRGAAGAPPLALRLLALRRVALGEVPPHLCHLLGRAARTRRPATTPARLAILWQGALALCRAAVHWPRNSHGSGDRANGDLSLRCFQMPHTAAAARPVSRARLRPMPTTRARARARGGAPIPRAAGGRAGPRALPANARPRHRCSSADVPRAMRCCEARAQVAAILWRVVALAGHTAYVHSVAAAPDGRIITGSTDVDRQGVARRRVRAHPPPGAPRHGHERGGAAGRSALRQRLGGRHREAVGARRRSRAHFHGRVKTTCVTALPDGVHFVVGADGEVRLYHIDGTLVHTFKGHTNFVHAVAVTPDGQHIIAARLTASSRCGESPARALCAPAPGTPNYVNVVAAMPDGQRFLSGDDDGRPRVAPRRHPREHLHLRAAHQQRVSPS